MATHVALAAPVGLNLWGNIVYNEAYKLTQREDSVYFPLLLPMRYYY